MEIKKNAGNQKNADFSPNIFYDEITCKNNIHKYKEKSTVRTSKKMPGNQKNATPLIENMFDCLLCNFSCKKQSNYEKHLQTNKHNKNINKTNINKTNIDKTNINNIIKENTYKCICNKEYNTNSGLYKHKRNCLILKSKLDNIINQGTGGSLETSSINISFSPLKRALMVNDNIINDYNIINETIDKNILENNIIISNETNTKSLEENMTLLTNLIVEVVKNNNEFQKQVIDLVKSNNTTNITNNMNNCNNQNTFNLQLFLNETCKDAINMSEFINSFNLQMSDLERLSDDGYVKTLSNLIINKVRELDLEKRPIHCTDAKREVIYIKEDDIWFMDDEDKSYLRKTVNKIGTKNIGVLQDWQNAHPNYYKSNSPYNDIYLKMLKEVVGGKDIRNNENKVIKNIIKEVVIDKKQFII